MHRLSKILKLRNKVDNIISGYPPGDPCKHINYKSQQYPGNLYRFKQVEDNVVFLTLKNNITVEYNRFSKF